METIYVLTLFSLLLLLCICSSKVSTWIKMPVLIVFLGVGMLIDLPKGSLNAESIDMANWIGSVRPSTVHRYVGDRIR